MKTSFKVFIGLILTFMNIHYISDSQVKIGVFADCQYCDCETAGTRFYRNSLEKLEDCISKFNQDNEIDFIVGLGDIIDRDFSSFDSVNSILAKSKKEIFQVIGNHDLEVEKSFLEQVPSKLNLDKTWYSFTKKGWHFIFLNGNDITFHSNHDEIVNQAKEMTEQLKKEGKPNYHEWNGGIGKKQLKWLEKELKTSQKKNQKVAVFCHYPLLPFESHALWNSEEVQAVLAKFNCVKIYLNGHNHAGNYTIQHGIHFVNLKGMVETKNENAFSIITFTDERIEIEGFGREESRSLLSE
jgi:manganese-dependent ADP-ribose/CDP-alcohol diphosphatase